MYFRPFRLLKLALTICCVIIVIYELQRLLSRPTSTPIINQHHDHLPPQPIANEDVEHISYSLDPFYIALPHFSDDEAKHWFYNSSYYKFHAKTCADGTCESRGVLFAHPKEHLSVSTFLVRNGLYLNDECGYNYADPAIKRTFRSESETTVIYDTAMIYTVPDGWSFQHFLDGIGPKLAHSWSYLSKYPDAKVVILQGVRFDRSVQEIWSMLGVDNSQRIIHYTSNMKVGARLLINPCRTPGIHPRLWQDARQMYWTISGILNATTPHKRSNLIYIQRTSSNAMNNGRLIVNEEAFAQLLRDYCTKHSLTYVQYDHSIDKGHIRSRIELFYNARVIIGVHSGALSNMNFAQSGTTIIEIMPYRDTSSSLPMTCSMFRPEDMKACAGYILYTQAQLLNQSYWMLPFAVNAESNIHVNLTRMQRLLDQI